MSYTLVPTELIVDGAITSAKLDTNIAISGTLGVTGEVTLATHLIMGDNDKIKIGTGGDLEIYHDGSNSYISNSTGNIYLGDTNGAVHIQAKLNEESIVASADGAVTLYHDNSAKLATASGGVTVTGTLTATTLAGTLSTAAQTNITSLGTITSFRSTGIDDNADALAITIDSSENVGITHTSPAAKLDIKGNTTTFDGMAKIYLTDNNSNSSSRNWSIGNGGSAFGSFTIGCSNAKDGDPQDASGSHFNPLVITNTGNVGIGINSPANKLDIVDSTAGFGVRITNNNDGSQGLQVRTSDNDTGLYILDLQSSTSATGTNYSSQFVVEKAGHVGIGMTSAPVGSDTCLSIFNSATPRIKLHNSTTGSTSSDGGEINMSSSNLIIENREGANIKFFTNGAERFNIDNRGNLSFGTQTTDPVWSQFFNAISSNYGGHLSFQNNGFPVTRLGNNWYINNSTLNERVTANPAQEIVLTNTGNFEFNTVATGTAGSTFSFTNRMLITNTGNVTISGSLSKGSGSFKINHPLDSKKDTHHLVHSFIEGPQADNIYRGVVQLENGTASINLDTVSGMTEGTYVLLNTNSSCFTSNETDWDSVKGSISGNILTINCQNTSSTATVSWLVIGERHDQHMKDTDWTDENGRVIVEPSK